MAQVQGKAIKPHARYVADECCSKGLFRLHELDDAPRQSSDGEEPDWSIKINAKLARRIRGYGDKGMSIKQKVEELINLGFSVKSGLPI